MSRTDRNQNRRRFESLEDRRLLAADLVTATVTGANLVITGDGNDDSFLVAGDGTAGDVVITGFTGTDGVNTTQINGSQNGTPVTGTPNGSITLTGVTGDISMRLGAGDVTVSVEDLSIGGNLRIGGGGGNDTVDIGAIAAGNTPASLPTSNAVTIGGNLSIGLGSGDDTVVVGAVGGTGTDVTVSRGATITVGGGDDTIDEDSLAVDRSETIWAAGGDDSILIGTGANSVSTTGNISLSFSATRLVKPAATVTASATTVAIGRDLSIGVGGGTDTVTEENLTVSGDDYLSVGAGDDTLTLGTAPVVVGVAAKAAAHAAAISQVVSDANVAIGGSLDIHLGSGDSSLTADDVSVGESLTISGGRGFGFGFGGFGGFGFGGFGGGFGGLFGGLLGGGLFGDQTDTITLDDVSAAHANIFTGLGTTDDVGITDSTFDELGVVLGTGAGNLSIAGTTTTNATYLIGLGSSNIYTPGTGNTFANLHTSGLTPTPTTPTVVEAENLLKRK